MTKMHRFAFALLLFLASRPAPAADPWKAGVSRAGVIARQAGLARRLWVETLAPGRQAPRHLDEGGAALEDSSGKRAVLITSDFQGVPKVMSDPVSPGFGRNSDLNAIRSCSRSRTITAAPASETTWSTTTRSSRRRSSSSRSTRG